VALASKRLRAGRDSMWKGTLPPEPNDASNDDSPSPTARRASDSSSGRQYTEGLRAAKSGEKRRLCQCDASSLRRELFNAEMLVVWALCVLALVYVYIYAPLQGEVVHRDEGVGIIFTIFGALLWARSMEHSGAADDDQTCDGQERATQVFGRDGKSSGITLEFGRGPCGTMT